MFCPECGAANEEGAVFCGSCGKRMPDRQTLKGLSEDAPRASAREKTEKQPDEARCAACGAALPAGGRFCGVCGAKVGGGAAPKAAGPAPRAGRPEAAEAPARAAASAEEESSGTVPGASRDVLLFQYPSDGCFRGAELRMIAESARRTQTLSYHGIASVLGVEEGPAGVTIRVERPEGERLDRMLARTGAFEIEKALAVAKSVLSALRYAHRNEMMHGDLAPALIYVDESGGATVAGFGFHALARNFRLLHEAGGLDLLTYAAPEQILDGGRTEATDLYSFGAILYEMLSGRPPFNFGHIALQHLNVKPRPVRQLRGEVSPKLEAVVMRCLEKDPAQRFQTADDLLDELVSQDLLARDVVVEMEQEQRETGRGGPEAVLSFDNRAFEHMTDAIASATGLGDELDEEESSASTETVVIEKIPQSEYESPAEVLAEEEPDREHEEATSIVHVDDEVRELFEQGLRFHNEGSYTEAINFYTQVIGIHSDFAPAHSNRALAYYDMGEFDQSILDYTRAIELNGKFAEAYLGRGLAYYKKGQLELAIADYQQALRWDPENTVARYNCGIAHYDLGEFAKAVEDYTEVLKRDPDHATAYYNRGIAHYKTGNWKDAIADFDKALELNDRHHTAYYNRGSIFHKMKDYERALADLTKAVEIKPDYVMAYYNRGNVCTKLGRLEDAVNDYTEVVKLSPNFVQAYFSRGCIYGNMGEYLKAVRDFEQAIALNPNYGAAYWNRAIAYEMLGYKKKAESDFKKAEELGYKP